MFVNLIPRILGIRENWLTFLVNLGEAELFERFREQRQNTFRELRFFRDLGRSMHNFREQGSTDPNPWGTSLFNANYAQLSSMANRVVFGLNVPYFHLHSKGGFQIE